MNVRLAYHRPTRMQTGATANGAIFAADAVQKAVQGKVHSLDDLRLFLKAAEEVILPCYNEPVFAGDSKLSFEENGLNLAKVIARELH